MALVKSLKPIAIEGKSLVLECPTEQSKNWIHQTLGNILRDEAYKKGFSIKLVIKEQDNPNIDISYSTYRDSVDRQTAVDKAPFSMSIPSYPNAETKLNPSDVKNKTAFKEGISSKYTFDNFIVGKQNEVAYRASLEVATDENSIYNPLFIYGKVGSGKTHLLQAIGNRAYSLGKSVIYTSMNDFTEEMVYYLKAGNIISFREKYKGVDILLIDDIQFLSGKERTQMELFNIFNYLFQYNKHIVFASDKHPRDIKDISERLVSRFEGGLLVETSIDDQIKLSIIKQKIQIYGLNVDERLISYIKDNTTNNAREIEGLVLQIKAKGVSILEAYNSATHYNSTTVTNTPKEISIDKIKKAVANYFNIGMDIFNKSYKNKKYATAKHIAIFLSREFTGFSLAEIAKAFNIKSHSSVNHSIKKIEKQIKEDKTIQYSVSSLREIIRKLD
ncbi:chromosomal replication initiator protein DnaA [Hydrogenobaculum sp. Y04AAS1]|nr:chromosomal replication initiator protein DnaA [Hydrogenobaculum sp. Y04AAS1]